MGLSMELVKIFAFLGPKILRQSMLSSSSEQLAPQLWFSSLPEQKEELGLVLVQAEQWELDQFLQAQLMQLACLEQFLQAQQ